MGRRGGEMWDGKDAKDRDGENKLAYDRPDGNTRLSQCEGWNVAGRRGQGRTKGRVREMGTVLRVLWTGRLFGGRRAVGMD